MLLGMIFRLYSEIFVEIHALFLEILRFEFVTLFVKHPVDHLHYSIRYSVNDLIGFTLFNKIYVV